MSKYLEGEITLTVQEASDKGYILFTSSDHCYKGDRYFWTHIDNPPGFKRGNGFKTEEDALWALQRDLQLQDIVNSR